MKPVYVDSHIVGQPALTFAAKKTAHTMDNALMGYAFVIW